MRRFCCWNRISRPEVPSWRWIIVPAAITAVFRFAETVFPEISGDIVTFACVGFGKSLHALQQVFLQIVAARDKMLRFRFSEILTQDMQQQGVLGRTPIFRIDRFIFEDTFNRIIVRKIALQHLHFKIEVRFRIQQYRRALLPVPPGSPDFLHIFLKRIRHMVMDHVADVRLIDSHSECAGGADDVQFILKELMLDGDPIFICPVGMIGFRAQICFFSDHECDRVSLCLA